jgi:two-component system response regulator HydG
MMRPRVLVADDKENIVSLLRTVLGESCDVTSATDGQRALALAMAGDFDVVVADIRMPGLDGFALLEELKRAKPDVEVVLMTAFGSVDKAVEAMRAGAYHYLTKPFEPEQAVLTVERAAERKRLRAQARDLRAALEAPHRFRELVGKGPKMAHVFELLGRAAAADTTVLITGESGTGKELAARGIHSSSTRQSRPFIAVGCAAVPEALMDPILSGGTQGPPAGASESCGLFEQARGGTLLFDEVSELAPTLQAKLTRVLQERTIRGAGEAPEEQRDARVIATSKVDLKNAVSEGQFREDLYYRLNVLRVHMPPLRERKEDIPLLAAHFLEEHGRRYAESAEGFTPEALSALVRYDWPGNVRELENAIERALAVIDGPRIPLEALPEELNETAGVTLSGGLARLTYREAVELARDRASREYLIALMREFGGSVTAAAERAGMERESLHRLLKRYGLRSNEFKAPS